jgi:cell division protein ZapA (FtsZ GTPase activity inhibitor)
MEELAIKIRIYDRQYPMKVHPKDEALVRKAAEIINNQLKAYQEKFDHIDIQDLLAMVAFDCLVESLRVQQAKAKDQEVISASIQSMIQLIDMT